MIVFRRRGTAQLVTALGVFAMPMANFGAWTDTTDYVVFGDARSLLTSITAQSIRPAITVTSLRDSITALDVRPAE